MEGYRFRSWELGQDWRCRHRNPSYMGGNEDLSLVAMAEFTKGKREREEYILAAAYVQWWFVPDSTVV